MEQRDLIKDQIEQFALALRRILSNFIDYKSEGEITQGIQISNEQISNELNIDVPEILLTNESDLKEYFKKNGITPEHLEILSTYLEEIGKTLMSNGAAKSKVYLKKSLELLELVDNLSKTISFERMNKKLDIENILQKNQ